MVHGPVLDLGPYFIHMWPSLVCCELFSCFRYFLSKWTTSASRIQRSCLWQRDRMQILQWISWAVMLAGSCSQSSWWNCSQQDFWVFTPWFVPTYFSSYSEIAEWISTFPSSLFRCIFFFVCFVCFVFFWHSQHSKARAIWFHYIE